MTIAGHAVTFDCSDAKRLAAFWTEVVGLPTNPDATRDFASIGELKADFYLMFARVPEGKTVKNRVHLDLFVDDIDAEVARLEKLGAKATATFTEDGRWTTMVDPQGNEFDIVANG